MNVVLHQGSPRPLVIVIGGAGERLADGRGQAAGLDKITARVSTIEAPVGQAVTFGALEITVRACDKRPPEEPPEGAAYLEIVERKVNEEPKTVFSGWMFASSPAVSALEHPVYDIWGLDCMSAWNPDSGTSQLKFPRRVIERRMKRLMGPRPVLLTPYRARCLVTNWVSSSPDPPHLSRATRCTSATLRRPARG